MGNSKRQWCVRLSYMSLAQSLLEGNEDRDYKNIF
jgi:hypothetical protein